MNAGADPTLNAGDPFTFTATFSDPGVNAGPWGYTLDFGDGSTPITGSATLQTAPISAVHTYADAGDYVAQLTVTDAIGASGVGTRSITVSPATARTLLVAGDISNGPSPRDSLTALLLDSIPGTVLTLGDNVFPTGTLGNYMSNYEPTWGRHKARTYAALGNNEYDNVATGGSADGSFDYFGDRAGPNRGLGYYSFDLGAWHIIALNTNGNYVAGNAGSAQDQWLQADLAANTQPCVLAFFHHPRFFSSQSVGFIEAAGVDGDLKNF